MFRPVNAAGGACTGPTRSRGWGFPALLVLTLCPIGAPAADVEPYQRAAPGYRYSFPRDHFEHSAFRTEWWYYTGNLRDSAGKRYGFELVFFRQGQRRGPAANSSAWRVDDLYLAHVAVTDISIKDWVDQNMHWAHYVVPISLAVLVVIAGKWLNLRASTRFAEGKLDDLVEVPVSPAKPED
jgi:hypothetical protein